MHPAPPLGGLSTYEAAASAGYGVDRTVALVKRYAYIEQHAMRCLAAHFCGVPEWEVKCAMALHLWQDAEHCTWLRDRVAELRNPPLRLDRVPEPALEVFFAELFSARTTLELLVGMYRVLKPALTTALQRHQVEANPLVDQPTVRLARFIVLEEEEQIAWGNQAIARLLADVPDGTTVRQQLTTWEAHLSLYLRAAGDVAGDAPRPAGEDLPPARAGAPFVPIRTPRRDARFTHLRQSRGLGPGPDASPEERNWHQLYVRLTEMHVPELLALIMHDWQGRPWELYRDLARHLWDETRHAMMGETAFETRGVDWFRVPHEISFAEFPNTHFPPAQRYALLVGIEQGLMKATGKRYQHETAVAAHDELSTLFHDYDWADEVLHVHIGRKWTRRSYTNDAELDRAFAEANEQYQEVLNEDKQSPGADWWDAFYRDLVETRSKV